MRTKDRTGNVLVVEDDASARQQLLELFSNDYCVHVARDWRAAIDVLRTRSIDTVTLDPWIPGIQGRDLLSRIREVNPHARVIIVTKHKLSLWFDDMVREEVFDYVPKPFEARVLLQSVRKSMVRPEAAVLSPH